MTILVLAPTAARAAVIRPGFGKIRRLYRLPPAGNAGIDERRFVILLVILVFIVVFVIILHVSRRGCDGSPNVRGQKAKGADRYQTDDSNLEWLEVRDQVDHPAYAIGQQEQQPAAESQQYNDEQQEAQQSYNHFYIHIQHLLYGISW